MRDLTAEARTRSGAVLYTRLTQRLHRELGQARSPAYTVYSSLELCLWTTPRAAPPPPPGACAVPHPQTRVSFTILGGAYGKGLSLRMVRLNALCTLILYRGLCSPVIHP